MNKFEEQEGKSELSYILLITFSVADISGIFFMIRNLANSQKQYLFFSVNAIISFGRVILLDKCNYP
jgi:hypothetical protein